MVDRDQIYRLIQWSKIMKEKDTKTQNKTPSKGAKIFSSVLNTIINIMIVIVLITSILIAVMAISSKASGISTILGYTIQPILSDSMKGGSPDGYPSGDFGGGDLMIAKATGFSADKTFEKGDIVTFLTTDTTTEEKMLIAHRIVNTGQDSSGNRTYQTQGDNRETSPVPDQQGTGDYITAQSIGSVYYTAGYEGKILKGWGNILAFLQSQKGFFFVVLLPMIIFFIYELIRVMMNFSDYKKAVAEENKDEAIKNAVAEALAAQKNESNTDMPSSLEEMSPEQLEQFKQFLKSQEEKKAAQNAAEPAAEDPQSEE